jgi:hypothetical protein
VLCFSQSPVQPLPPVAPARCSVTFEAQCDRRGKNFLFESAVTH